MACATNRDRSSGTLPPHQPTYEDELAAMNRRRVDLFRELRGQGADPATALAVVNRETLLADRDETTRGAPLFDAAELALLRASDRVVDQQEPGGKLYRADRAASREPRADETISARVLPDGTIGEIRRLRPMFGPVGGEA